VSQSKFSKRLFFWTRITLFVGVVAVGIYFVIDPATPRLYKLLIAAGLLGLLLYFLLGRGGGKVGPLGGGAPTNIDH
jgi:hypothetical protein